MSVLHVVAETMSLELRNIFPFGWSRTCRSTNEKGLKGPASSQSKVMLAACDLGQKEHFVIANYLYPNSAEDCSLHLQCCASLNNLDPVMLSRLIKCQ